MVQALYYRARQTGKSISMSLSGLEQQKEIHRVCNENIEETWEYKIDEILIEKGNFPTTILIMV